MGSNAALNVSLFLVTLSSTCVHAVGLMSALWQNDKSVKVWTLPRPCAVFRSKYDDIQEQLQTISYMDELLSGKSAFDYILMLRINTPFIIPVVCM